VKTLDQLIDASHWDPTLQDPQDPDVPPEMPRRTSERASASDPPFTVFADRFEKLGERMGELAEAMQEQIDRFVEDWQGWGDVAFYYDRPEELTATLVIAALEPELEQWAQTHGRESWPGSSIHFSDAELGELATFVRTHARARRMLRQAVISSFCQMRDDEEHDRRAAWFLSEVHRGIADRMRDLGVREK
jgi:hypothetical protein